MASQSTKSIQAAKSTISVRSGTKSAISVRSRTKSTKSVPADNDDEEEDEAYKGCGGGPKDKEVQDYDSIPIGARLTLRQHGKLSKMKDMVEKPEGSIPEPHLPSWPTMPMESKIPDVQGPKGALILSRGRLAEKLLRPLKQYHTEDPLNREMVILPRYNSLHDPGLKGHLSRPTVVQVLLDQGLCTDGGQVICSLKEFNEYRHYLDRTVYNDEINSFLVDAERHNSCYKDQLTKIEKHVSETTGKDFKRKQKIDNARKFKEDETRRTAERLEWKQQHELFRYVAYLQKQQEDRDEARLRGLIRDSNRAEKVKALAEQRLARKGQLMNEISRREKYAAKRQKAEKELKDANKNQALLERLDAKFEAQKKRMEEEESLQKSIAVTKAERAGKRQRTVEFRRAQLPQIIEARKEKEKKVWALVRKYFYLWLEKVRARRARKPDAMHKSLWDVPQVFDQTVTYLRKESGYEKLDDFIMGIVKLKRDIKAELEAEEAAERELAEREALQGNSTDEETA